MFLPCRPANGSNVMLALPLALMRRTLRAAADALDGADPCWVKPAEVLK